jgi:hypothetical protein
LFYFKGEISLKKDKLITMKINKIENDRIEYICDKLDMNRTEMILYLCDLKYFELLHKEDGINE